MLSELKRDILPNPKRKCSKKQNVVASHRTCRAEFGRCRDVSGFNECLVRAGRDECCSYIGYSNDKLRESGACFRRWLLACLFPIDLNRIIETNSNCSKTKTRCQLVVNIIGEEKKKKKVNDDDAEEKKNIHILRKIKCRVRTVNEERNWDWQGNQKKTPIIRTLWRCHKVSQVFRLVDLIDDRKTMDQHKHVHPDNLD